jgi:hypothetical protein
MLKQPPDDNAAPEYVAPASAMLMFEAGRDVALDGILRRDSAFDLGALQAADPEMYWQLIDLCVQVEKLTQPVRREFVLGILEDIVTALYNAAENQR